MFEYLDRHIWGSEPFPTQYTMEQFLRTTLDSQQHALWGQHREVNEDGSRLDAHPGYVAVTCALAKCGKPTLKARGSDARHCGRLHGIEPRD